MRTCGFILTVAVFLFFVGATVKGGAADSCTSNDQCPRDCYCAKADGDCDGSGRCAKKPVGCPRLWAPVCGCDGQTYSNECEAAAAGVNVDYAGECSITSRCTSNADCSIGSYCDKADGDCNGVGQCAERPLGCPDVWAPVCGCDGVTYSNECEAAAAGVNVDYAGECSITSRCTSNADCSRGSYCEKADGDCDGVGQCSEKPVGCPEILDPVCGCDGVTYSNECEAAAAGINVDYTGECSTISRCASNADCPRDNYCAKADGDCDGRGQCAEKPLGCPDVWAPVCGCDGVTYSNECEAAAAGISVNYTGECLPPGPTIVMLDPNVATNDVHTGRSGLQRLRILWSEAVIFNSNDITIVDEDRMPVRFSFAGSNTAIMTITFRSRLIYDRYTITIRDSAVSSATGYPVDGDNNRATGGNAVIVVEHRMRSDLDNNNLINFQDVALFADIWLAELD